jgi:hypothetical protein
MCGKLAGHGRTQFSEGGDRSATAAVLDTVSRTRVGSWASFQGADEKPDDGFMREHWLPLLT